MNHKGFTLIELLVVVAIIGILAAIAIPRYAEYRVKSFNAKAQSDLRNMATAQHAYFIDNENYAPCDQDDCESVLESYGFVLSDGVSIDVGLIGDEDFGGESCHARGDLDFQFSSGNGVMASSGNSGTCAATAPSS